MLSGSSKFYPLLWDKRARRFCCSSQRDRCSFGICRPNSRCLWTKSSWKTPLSLEGILKMSPFVGGAIRPFTAWDRDTGRPLQTFNILIRPCCNGNKQAAGGKYRGQTQGAKGSYFKTGCICVKSWVMRKSFSWNFKSTLECLCRSVLS